MSVGNSIRNAIPPIHHDGHKFIFLFGAITVAFAFVWQPLFWIGLALTVWCALFFRDPMRVTPVSEELVISPADGKISQVGKVVPPPELNLGNDPMLRVSVFMNVFNCHVNRAPVKGRLLRKIYRKGTFLNAELDKASDDNERNSIVIDSPNGEVGVVQIAGLVARRIICWAKESEQLDQGERFGLIRFGSRLDVYLPEPAQAMVSVGQTAVAGETVLARFDEVKLVPLVRKA